MLSSITKRAMQIGFCMTLFISLLEQIHLFYLVGSQAPVGIEGLSVYCLIGADLYVVSDIRVAHKEYAAVLSRIREDDTLCYRLKLAVCI